jgi:hypothetical protein
MSSDTFWWNEFFCTCLGLQAWITSLSFNFGYLAMRTFKFLPALCSIVVSTQAATQNGTTLSPCEFIYAQRCD